MSSANPHFLIAQNEPPLSDGGDYYYRTHAPGLAMSEIDGVYVINLTNDHRERLQIMRKADVLILKNICDPDILPIIRARKANNKLTVYEIADDLTAVPEWNPVYFFFKSSENQALFRRIVNCSDIVQVTCSELEKKFYPINKSIDVIQNQLSIIPQKTEKSYEDQIIIGWGGSYGHIEDMREIAAPVTDFVNSHTNVKLNLMCAKPIQHLFDRVMPSKINFYEPGSIYDYYSFVNKLHIGLAPLADTAYNRSRSDVKFLEYAVSGAVPVVTNLAPYRKSVAHGETGFLYSNIQEMIDILETLLDMPSLMEKIACNSREYILKYRLLNDHIKIRVAAYKGNIINLHERSSRDTDTLKLFHSLRKISGAVQKGRHIKLNPGPFEQALRKGLVQMQIMNNKKEAIQSFNEASIHEPLNYLPFLFGSLLFPDPECVLLKAIEYHPESIKSWLMLGDVLAKRGNIIEALQAYENALTIYPDYELPYIRTGNLLKQIGEEEKSSMLFKKAEELQKALYINDVSEKGITCH